jgi:hypothetical protein
MNPDRPPVFFFAMPHLAIQWRNDPIVVGDYDEDAD